MYSNLITDKEQACRTDRLFGKVNEADSISDRWVGTIYVDDAEKTSLLKKGYNKVSMHQATYPLRNNLLKDY